MEIKPLNNLGIKLKVLIIFIKQYVFKNKKKIMTFSDDEYFEVIQKNENVKEAFNAIKDICKKLKNETNCPEEDIDYFLKFIAGKWMS